MTIREEAVAIAVRFLSDPAVKGSGRERKRAFLKEKGLSEEEIEHCMFEEAALPPLPPMHQNFAMVQTIKSYKYWLFLMVLGASTVAFHYKRVMTVSIVAVIMIMFIFPGVLCKGLGELEGGVGKVCFLAFKRCAKAEADRRKAGQHGDVIQISTGRGRRHKEKTW